MKLPCSAVSSMRMVLLGRGVTPVSSAIALVLLVVSRVVVCGPLPPVAV